MPPAVHQLRLQKREGGEGVRVWVDDLDGLLGLLDMDVVEVHPWGATVDDIEHPDLLVFDLDPGQGIEWDFVTGTALALRDQLVGEGLPSWPKLTGGKGLHVMVPIERSMAWDEAHDHCKRLAARFIMRDSSRYTISAALSARQGGCSLTTFAMAGARRRSADIRRAPGPGFQLRPPVSWADVEHGVRPDAFSISGGRGYHSLDGIRPGSIDGTVKPIVVSGKRWTTTPPAAGSSKPDDHRRGAVPVRFVANRGRAPRGFTRVGVEQSRQS